MGTRGRGSLPVLRPPGPSGTAKKAILRDDGTLCVRGAMLDQIVLLDQVVLSEKVINILSPEKDPAL